MKLVRNKLLRLFVWSLLASIAGFSTSAVAGIVLNSTRIILGAGERNASTVVSNITRNDYAVQVWINDQTDSDQTAAPFIVMPALFRVRAGEEQVVRIIKTPGLLPEDRESIFYFNAQEIPVADKEKNNALKVAIRTRLKFFYRPESLPIQSIDAPSLLQWTLVGQGAGTALSVNNPSPYHITFAGVSLMVGGKAIQLKDTDMVAPYSTMNFAINPVVGSKGATVEYSVINDYGGYSKVFKVKLLP